MVPSKQRYKKILEGCTVQNSNITFDTLFMYYMNNIIYMIYYIIIFYINIYNIYDTYIIYVLDNAVDGFLNIRYDCTSIFTNTRKVVL